MFPGSCIDIYRGVDQDDGNGYLEGRRGEERGYRLKNTLFMFLLFSSFYLNFEQNKF